MSPENLRIHHTVVPEGWTGDMYHDQWEAVTHHLRDKLLQEQEEKEKTSTPNTKPQLKFYH